MSRVLLIDGNFVLHQYHGRGFSNSDDFPTSSIYGFFQTLRKQLREREIDSVVTVFDGGMSDRRQEILETYKEGRGDGDGGGDSKSRGNDVLKQISFLDSGFLEACGIHSVRLDGEEGDDVLAVISELVDDSLLYSADKDFVQLIDESTAFVKKGHGEEELIDHEDFREEWEFDASEHLLWLAIKGDSSDAIGGVEGVGDKRAEDLVREHGDLDSIVEACEGESAKYKQAVAESRDLIERNLRLIDLSLEKFTDDQLKYVYKKLSKNVQFDEDEFVEGIETLDFHSFQKSKEDWVERLSSLEPCSEHLKPQEECEKILAERLE